MALKTIWHHSMAVAIITGCSNLGGFNCNGTINGNAVVYYEYPLCPEVADIKITSEIMRERSSPGHQVVE